jgi:NodT family efflux transporter outer membrane factor (OMF) lipoprotein
LLGVIAWNFHLYGSIAKGFFPQQDTGRIIGFIQADQATSFQAMQQRLDRFLTIVRADPAVEHVTGFTGGAQRNSAQMFMSLKPLAERDASAEQVVSRLRPKLAKEAGANLFMVPVQDIRVGGRQANAAWQYTLQSDTLEDLRQWSQRIRFTMMGLPEITDVNFDQQDRGMQTSLVIDRDAATRLGLSMRTIDATLNDAFGQRQIGVIYNPLNQYRVVMELGSEHLQGPESLRSMVFINSLGERIPLLSFARMELTNTPLSVNHQSGTPATTIAFNLAPGVALSEAAAAIEHAVTALGPPAGLRGTFQGTARAFAKSLDSQPLLILAALVTIYLVLGILYESLIHPITILSTLPSAGIGALLALQWFDTELSVIAFIGVILLIGIVKKNAIMMIDFAIDRQRRLAMSAGPAIYRAAHLRFRPILMTSVAAILGAVPLAAPQLFGAGDGAELRRPLGIAVVGGLVLSQILTLYTTPVVYLLMDRLRAAVNRGLNRGLTPITLATTVALSACTTHAPAPEVAQLMQMPVPAAFKASGHWKPVDARAANVPDTWWTLFADPVLNGLQERLAVGNENLKAAAAQMAAAQAALASSRAASSPTLGLGASASHGVTTGGVAPTTTHTLSLNASWELDLWGRLAATSDAAQARAQASSADLAAARLSAQGLLTQTYLQLRQTEAQAALLERTVLGYQRSLELTQNRYRAGVVSAQDVAQATTQLRSTQAQLIDLQTSRTQLEHTIATLLGQPAALLTVARTGALPIAPAVPLQLPSSLLQRRPDIAAQAARVAAAKAQFGVAEAAFFPQLTLTGSAGYRGPDLLQLVNANQLFWSLGPSLALGLLDGGARQAGVASARAGLDLAGAQYRQTVLTALQEVEDSLTGAAGLQENALLQGDAADAAAKSLEIAENQYKAGTVSYQSVVTAQTTQLSAQRALLDVQGRRLQALATLLKNLGGRWSPE